MFQNGIDSQQPGLFFCLHLSGRPPKPFLFLKWPKDTSNAIETYYSFQILFDEIVSYKTGFLKSIYFNGPALWLNTIWCLIIIKITRIKVLQKEFRRKQVPFCSKTRWQPNFEWVIFFFQRLGTTQSGCNKVQAKFVRVNGPYSSTTKHSHIDSTIMSSCISPQYFPSRQINIFCAFLSKNFMG